MKHLFLFVISLFIITNACFAQDFLISQEGSISTCQGKIFDSGGHTGNYSNNENYTITICNPDPNGTVKLKFIKFETARLDVLTIYDGPNTSGSIIVSAENIALHEQTVSSTQNCMTLNFVSDGYSVKSGFEAEISCGFVCQDYSISLLSASPELLDGPIDSVFTCPNMPFQVIATANFPNNNHYPQTLDGLTWYWSILSEHGPENIDLGVGGNILNYNGFDTPGVYFLNLTTKDSQGCSPTNEIRIKVYVSVPPTFQGTYADPIEVCVGQEINLIGSVTPEEWQYVFPLINTDTVCFSDEYNNARQEAPFFYSSFAEGQVITDVMNDLESVDITFEHSYLGDMQMYLECPNANPITGHGIVTFIGSPVQANGASNSCQRTYMGTPIPDAGYGSNVSNPVICNPPHYQNIGIMAGYSWSPTATISMEESCPGNSMMLIPTTYGAKNNPDGTSSFLNLNGCPLNGTWKFVIVDSFRRDDGALGSVKIEFSEDVMPVEANYEHFLNVYDISPTSTKVSWIGNGVVNINGSPNTAIPTEAGMQTYSFTAIDDFGCAYDTLVNVNVLPIGSPDCCLIPNFDLGPDAEVCALEYTFSYEMPQVNSGTWSLVSGPGTVVWSNQNDPNASVSVSENGEYVFKFTEYFYGNETCFGEEEISISFWPTPTNDFTFSPIDCYRGVTNIFYTGNMTETAEFNWNFGNGQIVSGQGIGPYQISWMNSGNHPVSLSVSENGCSSQESQIIISSPEELVSKIEVFDNTCFDACNGYAIATVTGGTLPYAYSWPSGVERVENLCAGNNELTVTDANGCVATESFIVGQPAGIFLDNLNISNLRCNGDKSEGKISFEVHGGISPFQYVWSDGGPSSASRINLDAGNYFLTVIDANDCNLIREFTITQPEELIVDIFPEFEICQGHTSSLGANAGGGIEPYTYYWDQGQGFQPSSANISVDLSETTYFNVYVKDANNCKSNTISSTAVVSPEMIIDKIETKDNRCYNSCDGKAEISFKGGLAPFTYSWNSSNNICENVCAGAYTVKITDRIGCEVTCNFVIEQPTKLVVESNIVDAKCADSEDGEIRLFAEGGIPNYSYLWPNGKDTQSVNLPAGEYTVTVSDQNDCRVLKTYTISSPDEITLMPIPDEKICKGQSVTLQTLISGGTPDYNYQWVGDDGSILTTNTLVVSPDETTDYQLVVEDANECKSKPSLCRIHVYPELKILSVASKDKEICPGEETEIFVDIQGGNGGPYQISLQDGSVVSSPFKVKPQESTLYTLKLEDLCGTAPVFASIKIDVKPSPEISFMANTLAGCVPLEVTFKESSPEERLSYLWDFGDSNFGETNPITYTYEKPGNYTVNLEVIDQNACKSNKSIVDMITVYPKPTASFQMSSEAVSFLSPNVNFSNLSSNARAYKWYFGDGDSSINVSPVHFYPSIGEFDVMLIAQSDNNCLDTITSKVRVDNETTFFMPNTFSPNGDGQNDFIRPCGNGISTEDFEFRIYDRWGHIVFRTNMYNPKASCDSDDAGAWDGTLKSNGNSNNILPNGVYYWNCEFKDWTGTKYSKSGTIALIR